VADFHAGHLRPAQSRGLFMNNIIYIVGLIVVVLAILSFLGLR
jgi:small-conductance mechanosensitive channel